ITADRDRLRGLLDDRQRSDVEALAAQRLRDGTDLWTTVDLADVLDDNGEVDSAKVTEAVEQLAAAKPHYAAPRPSFDLGNRGGPVDKGDTFADVLRGRR
ncbi:MAG: hypothetical protein M3Q87_02575, partial [Actinomycetota bacterium]|nr:hypothetical protein [Actinomycetota bacterium]